MIRSFPHCFFFFLCFYITALEVQSQEDKFKVQGPKNMPEIWVIPHHCMTEVQTQIGKLWRCRCFPKGAERGAGRNLESSVAKCRSRWCDQCSHHLQSEKPILSLNSFTLTCISLLGERCWDYIRKKNGLSTLQVLIPIHPKEGAVDALTQNLVTTWHGQVPLRCWFCEEKFH